MIFQESGLAPTCHQCLEEMAQAVNDLEVIQPEDQSLREAHAEHVEQWRKLRLQIEELRIQLEEVPERWNQYRLRSA